MLLLPPCVQRRQVSRLVRRSRSSNRQEQRRQTDTRCFQAGESVRRPRPGGTAYGSTLLATYGVTTRLWGTATHDPACREQPPGPGCCWLHHLTPFRLFPWLGAEVLTRAAHPGRHRIHQAASRALDATQEEGAVYGHYPPKTRNSWTIGLTTRYVRMQRCLYETKQCSTVSSSGPRAQREPVQQKLVKSTAPQDAKPKRRPAIAAAPWQVLVAQ